jgi:hypothetical protein
MDEATLRQSALHKSLEARQTRGQAHTPAAASLREEYAAWGRVLQGLKMIQADLERIERAERARIDR